MPPYFKYVLKCCGYNNGYSISTIDDDDIKHFIDEVRNGNVSNFFQPKLKEEDVLEGSSKTKDNFEFSRGHLKFLKSIVKFLEKHIAENGTDSFGVDPEISNKKSVLKKSGDKVSSVPKKRVKRSAISVNLANTLELQKHKFSKENGKQDSIENQKGILIRRMLISLSGNTGTLYAKVSMYATFMIGNGFWITVNN